MSDPVSAERQRVLDLIDDWLGYYPDDIFPPLALGQENSHDQIAAHAMRHVLRGLREQVEDGDTLPDPVIRERCTVHNGIREDGMFICNVAVWSGVTKCRFVREACVPLPEEAA